MNSNICIRGSSWSKTVHLKEVEHGKPENKDLKLTKKKSYKSNRRTSQQKHTVECNQSTVYVEQ